MTIDIATPTLVIDQSKCLRNITAMVNKAQSNGIPLRPHFKTHQSHKVGQWYRSHGVDRIAVSSLKMASYFAEDGWNDITVAFPTNPREIDTIKQLSSSIHLNLIVENLTVVHQLGQQLQSPVHLYIKADIGYHRTGLSIDQVGTIDQVIQAIVDYPTLHFTGFLAHAGHSYQARTSAEIVAIHEASLKRFIAFKDRYQDRFPDLQLSYGDTPTCSVIKDFSSVDEIRPGNFVFYDLSQFRIGSCTLNQIAVAMACPIVAKHANRSEIVIYGGGVHFSKDRSTLPDGTTYYGLVVHPQSNGWTVPGHFDSYVKSLSQEHGIIKASPTLFEHTQVGDLLWILPIHSCMAANAMKHYRTLSGEHISMMQ